MRIRRVTDALKPSLRRRSLGSGQPWTHVPGRTHVPGTRQTAGVSAVGPSARAAVATWTCITRTSMFRSKRWGRNANGAGVRCHTLPDPGCTRRLVEQRLSWRVVTPCRGSCREPPALLYSGIITRRRPLHHCRSRSSISAESMTLRSLKTALQKPKDGRRNGRPVAPRYCLRTGRSPRSDQHPVSRTGARRCRPG